MDQQQLFSGPVPPTRVRFTTPVDLGTGDCGQIATGFDGCDYVIKDQSIHHAIPHAEWFCSELGELVGVASPTHKVIAMPDGSTAFGSRWAGGALSPDEASPWWERVKAGEIDLANLGRTLSRIYALDQFVRNLDRHAANVLVHKQHHGHSVLAFDYSQAWTCFGFPLDAPPLPMCRTVEVQRKLSSLWATPYIDPSEVKSTCEEICSIDVASIVRIISSHPPIWLDERDKVAIINWWGSDDMNRRLDDIIRGVENGDYL